MGQKAEIQTHTVTEETVSRVESLLQSDKISNGISSLLEALPNSFEMPQFNSAEDTIYLQLATSTTEKWFTVLEVILPNPLSYNRSVCVIASCPNQDEPVIPKLTALIKEIGITGDISVISVEQLKELSDTKCYEKMSKLAESYDMFIIGRRVLSGNRAQHLLRQTKRFRKSVSFVGGIGNEGIEFRLKIAFKTSFSFLNSTKDTYLWRVGHRAMSESEIHENVTAALNKLSRMTKAFPEGLAHFSAVRLANAAGLAVNLYINPGDAVLSWPYSRSKAGNTEQGMQAINAVAEEEAKRSRAEILARKAATRLRQEKARDLRLERKAMAAGALKMKRSPSLIEVMEATKKVDKKLFQEMDRALRREIAARAGTTVQDDTVSSVTVENPEEDHPVPAKKPKIAPNIVNPTTSSSANSLTPVGALGALKKKKRNKRKPNAVTPGQATANSPVQAQRTVATPGSAPVIVPTNGVTSAGTPGSGKKRKLPHNNTSGTGGSPLPTKESFTAPKTPLMGRTPLKVETPSTIATPGSVAELASANGGTPAGTPGSAKKRRRSRNKGTPRTGTSDLAKENPSLKTITPLNDTTVMKTKTTMKVETPLQIFTPGSVAELASANGATPAGNPGSAKKRRRSRNKGTPSTGRPDQANKNTPLNATTPMKNEATVKIETPLQIFTPGSVAVLAMVNGDISVGSPGSRKKREQSQSKGSSNTGSSDQAKENTPLNATTPIKTEVLVKVETPLQVVTHSTIAVLASVNGKTPAGNHGSANKKRRRSRNKGTPSNGTPDQAKENTPLKAETPVSIQKTPLKENTALIEKLISPGSIKVEVLDNGV